MPSPLKDAALKAEKELILKTLRENDLNLRKSCSDLKIDRKTLYNKLKLLKITRENIIIPADYQDKPLISQEAESQA